MYILSCFDGCLDQLDLTNDIQMYINVTDYGFIYARHNLDI